MKARLIQFRLTHYKRYFSNRNEKAHIGGLFTERRKEAISLQNTNGIGVPPLSLPLLVLQKVGQAPTPDHSLPPFQRHFFDFLNFRKLSSAQKRQ